jgi:biotin/methionine sulfoxide reductase
MTTVRSGTTLTHWGAFRIETDGHEVRNVQGVDLDPDPSEIGALMSRVTSNRVLRPAVRASWLESGLFADPDRRGDEPLVDVDWETALDLAARAIDTVRSERGNESIFAGSYGWASAGRFHHAQSQLKRFLNCVGGFVGSIGTYSVGAAEVVAPRVLGLDVWSFLRTAPPVAEVVEHTELFVSLGGFPAPNTQVSSGGEVVHWYRSELLRAAQRGCRFVAISPTLGEFDRELGADWIPIRPSTDTALMLGIAGELVGGRHHDRAFLDRFCSGVDPFLAHLDGRSDGVAKDAEWAAAICGIEPDRIKALSRALIERRSVVNATWSTQRVEHGEQAVWALIALGAVVGKIGRPGEGVAFGYGSVGSVGSPPASFPLAALPQGENPVADRIPVSRIADALSGPGRTYEFDGEIRVYPDIDLVYWCGGNPFHHHQDLRRLDHAWRRPRAVLVNEPFWTATARRADIVFPATTALERHDIGGSPTSRHLVWMEQVLDPVGDARDDHFVFTALADRLGVVSQFAEGRTIGDWLEWMYEEIREREPSLPEFDDFRQRGIVERPPAAGRTRWQVFLDDPLSNPLDTPTGRIELSMSSGSRFPRWDPPTEWIGSAGAGEFHLISPMSRSRLHSQLALPEDGPAVVMISSSDAAGLGIEAGRRVELWNDRGRCAAIVYVSPDIMPGVVMVENGLPLELGEDGMCVNGNPNVLTSDQPTSVWGQATAAHSCLVRVDPSRGGERR